MPWRPPTVGMFLISTAKVPASRPRDAGTVITFPALSLNVAHSRCGSLGNATFDALDVPIERAEGGVRHHATCGNHFFPAIVLDRSGVGALSLSRRDRRRRVRVLRGVSSALRNQCIGRLALLARIIPGVHPDRLGRDFGSYGLCTERPGVDVANDAGNRERPDEAKRV